MITLTVLCVEYFLRRIFSLRCTGDRDLAVKCARCGTSGLGAKAQSGTMLESDEVLLVDAVPYIRLDTLVYTVGSIVSMLQGYIIRELAPKDEAVILEILS